MKTKGTLITVLTAALLVSAALIIGCSSPGDGMSAGLKETKESNFKAPPGKGIVRLNVSDKNARTIMPDSTSLPIANMYFIVEFESSTGGTDFTFPSSGTLIYNDIIGTPIVADAGEYNITITAFENQDGTNPIAGWSSDAPGYGSVASGATGGVYEVTISGTTDITANLVAFGNGANTGYFVYSISIPNGSYDSAKFGITRYSSAVGGFPSPIDLNITPGTPLISSPGYTLPSGYYTVTVTLTKAHYRTIYYRYALHIYPAMTSTLNLDVDDPLVQNEFELSFNVPSALVSNFSAFASKYVGYATVLSDTGIVPAPAPSAVTTSFDGWWSDADFLTGKLTLSNERILNANRTLYAKLTPGGASSPNGITITFDFADQALLVTASGTIHRNTFSTISTVTIALPDISASGGSWTNVSWQTGISSVDAAIASTHKQGDGSLVINNSSSYYPVLSGTGAGSFQVTLYADISGSDDPAVQNGPYSKNIKVLIDD